MSSTSELSSSLWNDGLQTTELSLPRSAFKSFNAQLAVGYPAYAMVICQHSHIKNVNNISWLITWYYCSLYYYYCY